LATVLHGIPIILAVATIPFLAAATVPSKALEVVEAQVIKCTVVRYFGF
jgi:hypothetical protein